MTITISVGLFFFSWRRRQRCCCLQRQPKLHRRLTWRTTLRLLSMHCRTSSRLAPSLCHWCWNLVKTQRSVPWDVHFSFLLNICQPLTYRCIFFPLHSTHLPPSFPASSPNVLYRSWIKFRRRWKSRPKGSRRDRSNAHSWSPVWKNAKTN